VQVGLISEAKVPALGDCNGLKLAGGCNLVRKDELVDHESRSG
jgi:hypothetical protein